MRGHIVSYFPPDRCFVIHPEGLNNGSDVMVSEDDLPTGCLNLAVSFDVEATANGFRATNVRADSDA
jgi:hypothetical protein